MSEIIAPNNIVIRTSRGLTIAGTRITLYTIMDYLRVEWPVHLIQDWFSLTDEQIQGALAYLEAHRDEVTAEYEQVIAEAEEIRQYWEEQNRERMAEIATLPPPPDKEAVWKKLQEKKAQLARE